MKTKIVGYAGLAAVVTGVSTIIIMAMLRTDGYNHLHKAVSELGSADAPNRRVFNFFGYIIPGLLVAAFAILLSRSFKPFGSKGWPFYFLAASGLMMSVAGIFPVDMEMRQSATSVLHTIGSLGSGVLWLVSALTLWWQIRKREGWRAVGYVTLLIPFLMVAGMASVDENAPGLAQRISFAAYYLFVLALAVTEIVLEQSPRRN